MKFILKINDIFSILLSIYLTFVICFSFKINFYIISLIPFIFFTIYFLSKKLFAYLEKIDLKQSGKIRKKELIIYLILIFLFIALSILANYPATTSYDIINQYNQALTNKYSDWHPLFHTLIFFKMPTLIYKGYISCSVFQGIFVGLVLVYFSKFCRKYFLNHKQTILLLVFLMANPTFIKMTSTLWKDIPFTYCMMLGTMFLIEIFISKGKWLDSNKNKILFILMSFGLVFFRHNGIVSFILMMLLLIVFYKNKRKFLIIFTILFLTIRFIITGPIYNYFKIGHNGGLEEAIGVPLNQISYIYNTGGKVTKSDLRTISKIAPLEDFKNYFSKTSFNNIKWNGKYDGNYVSKEYKKILGTWTHMIINNPGKAIASYGYVTSSIWRINSNINFIEYTVSHNPIKNIINNYNHIMRHSFLRIFIIDVGEGLFIIIMSLLFMIKKQRKNLKAYIPYVLSISNVLIIMLLITGEETRFVYSSIICCYPLMLYALKKYRTEKSKNIRRYL